MKLDAITSVSALDLELHSITRSGVVHCIRSPDNMNFPPHTTSPPPINGIKYQSFLHNYSSTDTSWVRHPIQVSPSSFHTYVPQMNTFKVPCWHCKYEFDIHSIFPRTTGNPVVDTIHDSKMNITDKHFLKMNTDKHFRSSSQPIRTSLKNQVTPKLLGHINLTICDDGLGFKQDSTTTV